MRVSAYSFRLGRRSVPILRFYNRSLHENCENSNEFWGFVGGCTFVKPSYGNLSPALAYIDQAFLNGGIKKRIQRILPKNFGSLDVFPATFMQHNYNIVYSSVPTRVPVVKGDEASGNEFKWPDLPFDKIKSCIGKSVQMLQKQGISEIYVDPLANPESVSEAAHLAAFRFDELKNPRKQLIKPQLHCFTSHLDSDPDGYEAKEALLEAWNRGRVLAQSQNLARRWMEMPANLFPPKMFAASLQEAFARLPLRSDVTVEVIVRDHEWCNKNNMGGIIGVSAGSSRNPVFVEIEYTGDRSRPNEHIALIGKGVTFDAGGISLKPSAGMEEMRGDMGGAAVIAATVFGLAKLGSPINIRAYLPLVENMPDGGALRPGDVLKLASGTSVQVDNTDAEGRLILADALHFAQHNPNAPGEPTFILDAATLTGAISVALGDHYTGLFCNAITLRKSVSEIWPAAPSSGSELATHKIGGHRGASIIGCLNYCGRVKSDPFWHMPSLYFRQMQDNCHLADLSNITTGAHSRLGGSGSAASFLQNFVGYRIPYVHLDIAGVMKSNGDDLCIRKGMSGRPTRSLIHFFDHISRKARDETVL